MSERRPPQLLPPDVTHFTDREAELGTLDSLLETDTSGSVVISAVAGTAGMGKTSLAVRWAYRVRDKFPDGQLYVNLRGYDPGRPVTPEQALDGFLRALDVPGEAIPQGVDAMYAHYRSLLAGRRMLVVLDNAATAEQVRPLLPASERCVVLVTSRSRLSGLVARDGARRLTLDLLPPEEAVTLLRSIVGADRADREPEALAELARRCAHLPLALRIAAERVIARPTRLIADLVADLTAEQDRLDALSADDDEVTTVRAVFSWSYRALTQDAARLFRLLGLHPGPEISVPAAAALADSRPATIRRLLDALAGVHLLVEAEQDRYTFHDLMRAYAIELAHTDEPEIECDQATGRVLEWYLQTAHAAARVAWPHQPLRPVDSPGSDVRPLEFTSYEGALGWLDRELANLMAAIHHADSTGWKTIASQLPMALGDFLAQRSHWDYRISAHQISIAAARDMRDRQAEFWGLSSLAEAYIELERFEEAIPLTRSALAAARDQGHRRNEGGALHDLGLALQGVGRLEEAMNHFQTSLGIFQEVDDTRAVGIALSFFGDTLRRQGRLDEALDYALRGAAVHRKTGNRWNEAAALQRLGRIYLDLERFDEAIKVHEQALAIFRDLDSAYEAAVALQDIGDTQYRAGDPDKARQSWREALTTFDDLNSPRAAEVRASLDRLG